MTFKTPDIFWQSWEVPVSNSIGDAVNDSRTKSISIVRVLNLKFNLYKTSFASCSSYKYISFALSYVTAQDLQLVHESKTNKVNFEYFNFPA